MGLVYHHTTADGIIGIIGGGALWATDINFLNDYEEYVAGMGEVLKVCERNKQSTGALGESVGKLYEIIPGFIRNNLERRSSFVTSFTKTRDSLRQWMAYGKPNASYSIGFHPDALKSISLDKENYRSAELTYAFKNVFYGDNDEINESLDRNLVAKAIKVRGVDEYAYYLVNILMFGLCATKRKEFADENEVRMILQTRIVDQACSWVRFRNLGGVITPYINVPIPLDAIGEIIIGPSINKDIAEKGVRELLKSKGLNCDIAHSACTLRQYS